MRATRLTSTAPGAAGGVWGRAKLRAILAAGIAGAVALVTGLGLAVFYGLRTDGGSSSSVHDVASSASPAASSPVTGAAVAGSGRSMRDVVAARPMMSVTAQDARRGVPAAVAGPVIHVPAATVPGAAGVPTGFPHTPQGAVGQLAAIETTVLRGMSIGQTTTVYQRWALPGGVGAAKWAMTSNVQSFLGSAGQGQTKDLAVVVTTVPVAAQVKGSDGPDWVLACVLLDIRATVTTEARMAFGYCERMQWTPDTGGPADPGAQAGTSTHGRWMIAPGTPAAPAPSTWPGTELSFAAGWRTWVTEAPSPTPPTSAPGDPVRVRGSA
ncbi:hypothetical protein V3N99_21500 [Dermatophilaceae bacterium Soc4.6]